MYHALRPLVSLLQQGRETDAVEYLSCYLGAANRRGRGSVELPLDRLTADLKDRLEGLGFEVRSTTVHGKPSLQVRVASASLPATARGSSTSAVRRREP